MDESYTFEEFLSTIRGKSAGLEAEIRFRENTLVIIHKIRTTEKVQALECQRFTSIKIWNRRVNHFYICQNHGVRWGSATTVF